MRLIASLVLATALAGCAGHVSDLDPHAPILQAEVEAFLHCETRTTTEDRDRCDCALDQAMAQARDYELWEPMDISVWENLTPTGELFAAADMQRYERREQAASRAKLTHIESIVQRASASCAEAA